ncbi:hypothetical protein APHCRT_0674 [Anaplasma phagocytophilum str. CRT53-1]|uniref:Uncharacterized protein n=3 Tax=Anaplasma phagocytophilum TaxID=948 RepID=Q2GKE7_ANAPZ|nr:hypothetical protein APH_0562 [Anaplasma phagocytophilum str. HZ]KJV59968.1 hypothetical protein APHWEB_1478 [Anaplasma phagocytophilum str. Webster]KJV83658.1 hypothetical protein APHHGE2_0833 [Anaplasma phagocytophilum str. HGE2]KJV84879.1 hypothetical protein APHWI1_0033 [Anaplasma phagocytophilum str. ApWI1]KJV86072.1 hypothetical protein APHCRT_0674 [Anaplasma phagocytophilum str. CRT53-1]KJV87695.1 hypothetical protein APHNYW_0564 [Anaplasma phagocytophilum str. ApNYW]KJV98965.1 hypo
MYGAYAILSKAFFFLLYNMLFDRKIIRQCSISALSFSLSIFGGNYSACC